VLALASGRADQFLTEARALTVPDETASPGLAALAQGGSCRLGTAMTRIQTSVARSSTELARVETLSARQEAQLARLEANRARMEGLLAAKAARLRMAAVQFNSADFSAVQDLKVRPCPGIRVNVPRPPRVRIPVVHVEVAGMGPA